jgi:hypothetical protein
MPYIYQVYTLNYNYNMNLNLNIELETTKCNFGANNYECIGLYLYCINLSLSIKLK